MSFAMCSTLSAAAISFCRICFERRCFRMGRKYQVNAFLSYRNVVACFITLSALANLLLRRSHYLLTRYPRLTTSPLSP
jgi:hypothetical protein